MPLSLVTPERIKSAFRRRNKKEGIFGALDEVNKFLDTELESKRGREAEGRGAKGDREKEERAAQRRREEIAGAQEFKREQAATVATREQDKLDLERQQRNETERLLNPLETQYGELSRQLVATSKPEQKQQIAVDMMNLESRIARMGGQARPVSEILQTQQLLNPQQEQPENPELEALIDELDALTDGPMTPAQRISIGLLKARLRKGDVQSMEETFNLIQSAMGGDEDAPPVKQFSGTDVGKAADILTGEEDEGGFDMDGEELDPNSFIDPAAFSRVVQSAVSGDPAKFSLGQAKAKALMNKYAPEAVEGSGMEDLVKRTFSGEFDAESLFNRPKSPEEAYRQVSEFYSDVEIRRILMDPEGRQAFNLDFGPTTALLVSLHFGVNPNIGTR